MNDSWKVFKFGLSIVFVVLLAMSMSQLFEHVGAGENLVVQSVFGNMTVYTDPGYKWQGFGKVTHYRKSFQYWFSSKSDQGDNKDMSIKVRYNDGGHANVSGSVRVDMPSGNKELLDIHVTFGSQEAVEQQLIRTDIEKSIYMTGPLMSSKESYAEKRNDMITYIEDQARSGVYQTQPRDVEVKDPISGEKRRITVVELKKSDVGQILRQEESPLQRFGIKLYNLSLNEIKYDDQVEKQIATQQEATMQVQTAIANAKKAEQDALTTVKQGEAAAAKAKWEQEQINAKVITEAEGKKRAAELDKQAAEFTKQKEILLGEGESTRKKLMMDANNALDARLEAWVKVNGMYAEAIKDIKTPLVPQIIMGGGGANGSGSVSDLIDLLKAKTAKEVSDYVTTKK